MFAVGATAEAIIVTAIHRVGYPLIIIVNITLTGTKTYLRYIGLNLYDFSSRAAELFESLGMDTTYDQ